MTQEDHVVSLILLSPCLSEQNEKYCMSRKFKWNAKKDAASAVEQEVIQ